MTALNPVSRLNTTISNHNLVSNLIAFGLLASVSLISAAAINYNGTLAKASYDTLVPTVTLTQKPAAKPAAKAQPKASTIALTGNTAAQLQPAQSTMYLQGNTTSPQSDSNSVQLTGTNPQTTASVQ